MQEDFDVYIGLAEQSQAGLRAMSKVEHDGDVLRKVTHRCA